MPITPFSNHVEGQKAKGGPLFTKTYAAPKGISTTVRAGDAHRAGGGQQPQRQSREAFGGCGSLPGGGARASSTPSSAGLRASSLLGSQHPVAVPSPPTRAPGSRCSPPHQRDSVCTRKAYIGQFVIVAAEGRGIPLTQADGKLEIGPVHVSDMQLRNATLGVDLGRVTTALWVKKYNSKGNFLVHLAAPVAIDTSPRDVRDAHLLLDVESQCRNWFESLVRAVMKNRCCEYGEILQDQMATFESRLLAHHNVTSQLRPPSEAEMARAQDPSVKQSVHPQNFYGTQERTAGAQRRAAQLQPGQNPFVQHDRPSSVHGAQTGFGTARHASRETQRLASIKTRPAASGLTPAQPRFVPPVRGGGGARPAQATHRGAPAAVSQPLAAPPAAARQKRTRGRSSPRPYKTLLVYPDTQTRGAVTVSVADRERLDGEEFLNDSLVDFYVRYLEKEVFPRHSSDRASRAHIFSSFFYKKLLQECSAGRPDGPEPLVGYEKLRTWTRRVDVFSKDFLIVPINEALHWSLAIICYPFGADSGRAPMPNAPAAEAALTRLAAAPAAQAEAADDAEEEASDAAAESGAASSADDKDACQAPAWGFELEDRDEHERLGSCGRGTWVDGEDDGPRAPGADADHAAAGALEDACPEAEIGGACELDMDGQAHERSWLCGNGDTALAHDGVCDDAMHGGTSPHDESVSRLVDDSAEGEGRSVALRADVAAPRLGGGPGADSAVCAGDVRGGVEQREVDLAERLVHMDCSEEDEVGVEGIKAWKGGTEVDWDFQADRRSAAQRPVPAALDKFRYDAGSGGAGGRPPPAASSLVTPPARGCTSAMLPEATSGDAARGAPATAVEIAEARAGFDTAGPRGGTAAATTPAVPPGAAPDDSDDDSDQWDAEVQVGAPLPARVSRASFKVVDPTEPTTRECQILLMDSLGAHSDRKAHRLLTAWLQAEWEDKGRRLYGCEGDPPRVFSPSTVALRPCRLPRQANHTDCGLFMLYSMEKFVRETTGPEKLPVHEPTWYRVKDASWRFRVHIRELIDERARAQKSAAGVSAAPVGAPAGEEEEELKLFSQPDELKAEAPLPATATARSSAHGVLDRIAARASQPAPARESTPPPVRAQPRTAAARDTGSGRAQEAAAARAHVRNVGVAARVAEAREPLSLLRSRPTSRAQSEEPSELDALTPRSQDCEDDVQVMSEVIDLGKESEEEEAKARTTAPVPAARKRRDARNAPGHRLAGTGPQRAKRARQETQQLDHDSSESSSSSEPDHLGDWNTGGGRSLSMADRAPRGGQPSRRKAALDGELRRQAQRDDHIEEVSDSEQDGAALNLIPPSKTRLIKTAQAKANAIVITDD